MFFDLMIYTIEREHDEIKEKKIFFHRQLSYEEVVIIVHTLKEIGLATKTLYKFIIE